MKIIHNYHSFAIPPMLSYLEKNNLKLKILNEYIVDLIEIIENENNLEVINYLSELDCIYGYGTRFQNDEILNSKYLVLMPGGMKVKGFPYPGTNFKYLQEVYGTSEYCETCRTGLIQTSPFVLQKEPKWGKSNSFTINWHPEVLFINKQFYLDKIKPLGIDFFPVYIGKNKKVSGNTIQLKIPKIKQSQVLKNYGVESCPKCKTEYRTIMQKGFFPKLSFRPDINTHIFLGREWFGNGIKYNRTYVSQELAKILMEGKVVKQQQLIPIEGSFLNLKQQKK